MLINRTSFGLQDPNDEPASVLLERIASVKLSTRKAEKEKLAAEKKGKKTNKNMKANHSDFILFKTEDEKISVDVRFEDETVWLTQAQLCDLFQKSKATISEHIKNIFEEGELIENSVVRNFRTTATDGKLYEVNYYNLDVIISVGYRVKSLRGTQFRQWATKRLNEYIRKGFTMDDERLKNLGGGGYWKELLQRIRDIRASEKVFYRQVLDIYSTRPSRAGNERIRRWFYYYTFQRQHNTRTTH